MARAKVNIGKFEPLVRDNFAGGVNYFYGSRQVQDNESPNAINCDFKGETGVGNRSYGYTQIGTVPGGLTLAYGLGQLHTPTLNQILAFLSDGTNVELAYSTGGAFTTVDVDFTNGLNVDGCEAASAFYVGNGTDTMQHWDGTQWNVTTNGKIGRYPAFYNNRIWIVDATNLDELWFSGIYPGDNTLGANHLGDFADANAGWIKFRAGSGAVITGVKPFKNYLYVFTRDSIYRLSPATSANVFTVELVTSAVGCVSHRSIVQVGEDLMFAADDGVYSLGDVANYLYVRTTNRSAKIQRIFDAMTGATKLSLAAIYTNFKYHLFYSIANATNDSVICYDVRYKAWQDWRNMAGQAASLWWDSTGALNALFVEPSTGKVQQMYKGTTDNGAAISSYWYSKSLTEDLPGNLKIYFDSTFMFGALNGKVTISKIFDDSITVVTKTLSQNRPQGGCGRDAIGREECGSATNTVTLTNVVNVPQRMKGKGKKFSVQYSIYSSNDWRLDSITEYAMMMDHFVFPSTDKLN